MLGVSRCLTSYTEQNNYMSPPLCIIIIYMTTHCIYKGSEEENLQTKVMPPHHRTVGG